MAFIKDMTTEQKNITHRLCEMEPDIVSRLAAEATADRLKTIWQGDNRVIPAGGEVCLWRLTGKRCPHWRDSDLPHAPPRADHVSLWRRGKTPVVYVSQPYGIRHEDLRLLTALSDQFGWFVSIDSHRSWHFPGSTLLIEIWASREACFSDISVMH